MFLANHNGPERVIVESIAKTDSVAEFCSATKVNDVDGMLSALAPDAELISPLSGRMVFRGREDLAALLGAVYGSLRDLHWSDIVGNGVTRVAVSEARIAGVGITDALVVELDDAGRIRRLRPHLRPWVGSTLMALRLGPALARHPGVVLRALRGHR
jgi:hypothetical protein